MKFFFCCNLIYSTTNVFLNTVFDDNSKKYIVTLAVKKLYAEKFSGAYNYTIGPESAKSKFEKVKDNQEHLKLYNIHSKSINEKNISKYHMFTAFVEDVSYPGGTFGVDTEAIGFFTSIDLKKSNKNYIFELKLTKKDYIGDQVKFILSKLKELRLINEFAKDEYELYKKFNNNEYSKKFKQLQYLMSETKKKFNDFEDYSKIDDDVFLSDDLKKYIMNKILERSEDFEEDLYNTLTFVKEIYSKCYDLNQELICLINEMKTGNFTLEGNRKRLTNMICQSEKKTSESSIIQNTEKKTNTVIMPNNFRKIGFALLILCIFIYVIYCLSKFY